MKKNVTRSLVVVALLIIAIVGFLIVQQPPEQETPMSEASSAISQDCPLRIGAAIALTGYGAAFGESERIALRHLEQENPDCPIFIEDTKSDPQQGLNAVRKLVDVHDVNLVYCDLTTVANAAVQFTAEREVLLVAAVYLTDLLDRSPLTVRNLPRGRVEARLLLERLAEKAAGPLTVVAMGSGDEFGRSALVDFRREAADYRVNIAAEETIADAALASQVDKLLALEPDAVYIATLLPHLGTLVKELRVRGFEGSILTTDVFAYDYVREAAGPYAAGVIYVDFEKGPSYETLQDQLAANFGQRSNPAGLLAYEATAFFQDYSDSLPESSSLEAWLTSLNGKERAGALGPLRLVNREFRYSLQTKVWE